MKVNKQWVEKAVDHLHECPRDDMDFEIAAALRKYQRVYEVAYEMVWARTHEHSKAAYLEMIDLIKGKTQE